jgi:hypothetical protein
VMRFQFLLKSVPQAQALPTNLEVQDKRRVPCVLPRIS